LGDADARATSSARTSAKASGTLPEWLVVKKQIGDRSLASTKQELSRHSGAQFDQAFMGQQLVAHMKVVDELTVYREHASGELRQIIESELQMAKAHLELARQTLDQISAGGDAPPRTARRPGSADTEPAPKPKTESRPQK
jgi:predicted outer membrane protein